MAFDAATDAGISFRVIEPRDEAFLRRLYRSVRDPELALTDWDEARKSAFANQQFDAQDKWYREQYRGAELLLILRGGEPVGRLYLYATATQLRVMDVALIPEARNAGLGTALMRHVQARAARDGSAVTLNVEIFNPARALYARLGFREEAAAGIYVTMRWDAAS
jgi:ribosomal protein S18 acetylase RimI-like enzyme